MVREPIQEGSRHLRITKHLAAMPCRLSALSCAMICALSYSSLPVHLCPPEFTIPELHAAYEVVLGESINMANFRRKLADLDLLEEVLDAMRSAAQGEVGPVRCTGSENVSRTSWLCANVACEVDCLHFRAAP